MKFFRFKVLYHDVFNLTNTYNKGFVSGKNYAEAAGKLDKWYGEDLVAIELLYETDNDIVLLDDAIKLTWKEETKD